MRVLFHCSGGPATAPLMDTSIAEEGFSEGAGAAGYQTRSQPLLGGSNGAVPGGITRMCSSGWVGFT
jgi:hypothetical protein